MNSASECPIIILSSGQKLKLERIKLYEADKVNKIATLKASAMQNMGGVSTGIGFWGSPAWAISGAAILGLLEGALSHATKSASIKQLRLAQDTYREMIYGAKYFPFENVQNLYSPHPLSWTALQTNPLTDPGWSGKRNALTKRFVHDGDEFVDVGTDFGELSVRWSEVAAYYPPQPKQGSRTAAIGAVPDDPPPSSASPLAITARRPPEDNYMIECRNCGRKSLTGTRFCPDCDHPLAGVGG